MRNIHALHALIGLYASFQAKDKVMYKELLVYLFKLCN